MQGFPPPTYLTHRHSHVCVHAGLPPPYHIDGVHLQQLVQGRYVGGGSLSETVFSGPFRDDPGGLLLSHDRAGLLSLVTSAPNSNGVRFHISISPSTQASVE